MCHERDESAFLVVKIDNFLTTFNQMESAVTAPVSGHIKRVVVQEGEQNFNRKAKQHTHAPPHRRFHQPG